MIKHANGTMTVTARNGSTATRKTHNNYSAAIVGRNAAGKLVVCFASWEESKAREALSDVTNGRRFVNQKFTGVTGLEIVVAKAPTLADAGEWVPVEDPDAWKKSDDALVAAHRAKKIA